MAAQLSVQHHTYTKIYIREKTASSPLKAQSDLPLLALCKAGFKVFTLMSLLTPKKTQYKLNTFQTNTQKLSFYVDI